MPHSSFKPATNTSAASIDFPQTHSTMSITHLASLSELDTILSKSKDKLSVIDFHATWCGPCHAIAPTFESLSKQYKNVNFLKCDVDAAKDIATRYAVSAMPTFIFLKGGVKVDQVRGANKAALEDAVRRHSGPASSSAFTGKGQTLGGGPAPIDIADVKSTVSQATGKVKNLDPQVKILLALAAAYLLFWYLS
ncbi:Peptide-N(4)-(N-acetyl-beta-glucosaminyl)asparagine amidase [Hypsizygus marmoreus]|uniref:Thioredoxin n=1 Tax=Hypsizygus marmoreus TaxID=39966 RepID=A0A369K756_HYPMA|nr:Peptide-N(4)-(N-acetyl-beta-glucosaminyl)asparagine amidase [Hypsizygus marmoreus]